MLLFNFRNSVLQIILLVMCSGFSKFSADYLQLMISFLVRGLALIVVQRLLCNCFWLLFAIQLLFLQLTLFYLQLHSFYLQLTYFYLQLHSIFFAIQFFLSKLQHFSFKIHFF